MNTPAKQPETVPTAEERRVLNKKKARTGFYTFFRALLILPIRFFHKPQFYGREYVPMRG